MKRACPPKRDRSRRWALLTVTLVAIVAAVPAYAQLARRSAEREGGASTLNEMVRTEQQFAARALVVGWKQAFLEYFDSKGRSYQRATSTFEVLTEQKPGEEIKVIDFSRKS